MERVIHRTARVAIPSDQAYRYFTENDLLESYFTVKADVEPVVGGKYELDWDPDGPPVQSTAGCRITALTEGQLLAFEWKGPPPHSEVMNAADPLTHVVVSFIPAGPYSTDVQIVHSGWRTGEQWHAAREYFDRAWGFVLDALVERTGQTQSASNQIPA